MYKTCQKHVKKCLRLQKDVEKMFEKRQTNFKHMSEAMKKCQKHVWATVFRQNHTAKKHHGRKIHRGTLKKHVHRQNHWENN